jgi:hypothetical protein
MEGEGKVESRLSRCNRPVFAIPFSADMGQLAAVVQGRNRCSVPEQRRIVVRD